MCFRFALPSIMMMMMMMMMMIIIIIIIIIRELTSRNTGSSVMVYFIRYDLSLASRYCALQ